MGHGTTVWVTAAIAEIRNANLYFLTLFVVLLVVVVLATINTVQKRRAPRTGDRPDDEGRPARP